MPLITATRKRSASLDTEINVKIGAAGDIGLVDGLDHGFGGGDGSVSGDAGWDRRGVTGGRGKIALDDAGVCSIIGKAPSVLSEREGSSQTSPNW